MRAMDTANVATTVCVIVRPLIMAARQIVLPWCVRWVARMRTRPTRWTTRTAEPSAVTAACVTDDEESVNASVDLKARLVNVSSVWAELHVASTAYV